MRTRQFFIPVIAVSALLASGCTINITMPGGDTSSRAGVTAQSEFTHQELMFAEMMIPHHEQALEMADLALSRSEIPEVLDLAARIKAGQAPEIEQMSSWLEGAGGAGMHHQGHGASGMDSMMMGGMASAADLARLASLQSPEFDRLFLELMIEHHEGALVMVSMISDSNNAEVAALAEDIIRVQKDEISEMLGLLGSL